MAFSHARFNVIQQGGTGAGGLAIYDARGSAAQGGDNRAAVIGADFFDEQPVKDWLARRRTVPVPTPLGGVRAEALADADAWQPIHVYTNDPNHIVVHVYLNRTNDQVVVATPVNTASPLFT